MKLPASVLSQFFLRTAVVAATLCLATCSRPPEPAPKRQVPPPSGTFPAFGAGGALHNVASEIGAPPMKVRWTYQAQDGYNGAAAIVGALVYVADAGGSVVALDLATGTPRWKHPSSAGFHATPLVAGDSLYIGDMAGEFFALDLANGNVRWTVPASSPIHAGANTDGERILFGTDAGLMLCLDRTGARLWSAQADGRINAPPAIMDGVAVFTSCDAHLRALRVADGSEVFKIDLQNLAPGAACVTDTSVYVGTDQGRVLSLSAKDGTAQWQFNGIADGAMVYASPALSGDVLVIGARDSHVYGLHPRDGSRLWSFAAGADVDASPVISGQHVYVASKDRRLHVLNLSDGKPVWSYETARAIAAPVAIAQGVVVVVDLGGTVYCLEPQ